MGKTAKFGILIKTDSYAGNFEREMCAHLTGHTGDCGVGSHYVNDDIAKEFEDIIGNEQDDNGCYRPVTIGSYENFSNNDVVIYFEEKPTQKHLDIIKERMPSFKYERMKIGIKSISLIEFKRSNTVTVLHSKIK